MKQLLGSALAVLATGSLVLAQAPPAPKPGPQHKAIGYFVGKWKTEAEIKPGLMGPGGKLTSTDSCEWFTGNFHVSCRSEGSGAFGNMTSIGILGYNELHKAYTYLNADSMGTTEAAEGQKKSEDKKTWNVVMEGKSTKM